MLIPILAIGAIFLVMKKSSTSKAKGALPNKTVPLNINTGAAQHANQVQSGSTAQQLETAAGGIAISYLAKAASAWAATLGDHGSASDATDPSTVNGDGSEDSEIDDTDLEEAEDEMGADSEAANGEDADYFAGETYDDSSEMDA